MDWSFLRPFESWNEPRTSGPLRETCKLVRARAGAKRWWTGRKIPASLADFWKTYSRGDLFLDVDYGQWGLELFSPRESKKRTQQFNSLGYGLDRLDIVIGSFRGDGDLLLMDGQGHAVVAEPIVDRHEWHVEADLHVFLMKYVSRLGAKYWTR